MYLLPVPQKYTRFRFLLHIGMSLKLKRMVLVIKSVNNIVEKPSICQMPLMPHNRYLMRN